MAVALTYAPGLQLSRILPFGVVATLLAMGLTAWQVERLGVADFAGYPLRLQTLGLPVALALLVLLIKQIWPDLGILAVIALVAPLLAFAFMPSAGRGPALKRQVVERFPAIGGQLVLFLGRACWPPASTVRCRCSSWVAATACPSFIISAGWSLRSLCC